MEKITIYSYSVLFSAAEEFKDKVPYIAALLENEQGLRFPALVEGYRPGLEIEIGQAVQCLTNAAGEKYYSV